MSARSRFALPVLALCACLVTPAVLAAPVTVFKWVDADGVTNYGSSPPAGVRATRLAVDGGRARPAEAARTASYYAADIAIHRERAMLAEIGRLQREADAGRWRSRSDAADPTLARQVAEECERQRRTDCGRGWVLQDYAPVPYYAASPGAWLRGAPFALPR